MAVLLHYRRRLTSEGDVIERKIWKVERSKYFPEGVKYSFAYIKEGKRILGYDNERMKGANGSAISRIKKKGIKHRFFS